jgi:glycosyltransferase involved in cell wall biosynthesis
VVGAVAEVERWYQAADAHLFTSWHEAFGLVLVEAAATGLRTLAFPVRGGANELLTALGALCVDDSSDDGELRAAVESVLTPERSDELRRTAVSRYSSEASAQRTLLEYEKALAAGSPR